MFQGQRPKGNTTTTQRHESKDESYSSGRPFIVTEVPAYQYPKNTSDMPTSNRLFSRVLIANRGEIAVRIIRTLRRLNIRSIAIYSKEDINSQHVRDADASYVLLGTTLTETYLSPENFIEVAKKGGAEAIIPGYGFLSENADFAEASRTLAEKLGIPVLPGSGVLGSDSSIANSPVSIAGKIGYPVMLKSSAGGGGLEIQKCNNVQELLLETFENVQLLSWKLFKDDSVFLEKFVNNARHIEVQIIGDRRGLVGHVWDGDCSMQRRKQKVIEEAPESFIPDVPRRQMREAAIKLAAAQCYRGVGTVEFLYDGDNTVTVTSMPQWL
ncbi:uncharacterized protein PAC_15391 [Phialocephala subalpina]|uniref:Uncharacterized protein n=1 Tax=Phialocephala subalpina TaxID=576137 RepID=A0A1L7XKB0_9HELO|nr:uncharacterized protein PAC_15391 [Phialocephala subalpina]